MAAGKVIDFFYPEKDYKDAMTSSLLEEDQRLSFLGGELSSGGASTLKRRRCIFPRGKHTRRNDTGVFGH